jgi:hypothetical protein
MKLTKEDWLNNEWRKYKEIIKPCWDCKFCPYGQLVEAFPIKKKRDSASCEIFGHDCPAFYLAEPFGEEKLPTQAAQDRLWIRMVDKWDKEMRK